MRKAHVLTLLVLIILSNLLTGCASNRFIVYKDGKAYYFASKGEGLHKMLCESGDFKRVLASSSMPDGKKKELYQYNCVEPSANKVQALYVELTPDQRKSLREAFEKEGYDINHSLCS